MSKMELNPGGAQHFDETGLMTDPHELRVLVHALAEIMLMYVQFTLPIAIQTGNLDLALKGKQAELSALSAHAAVCEDVRDELPDLFPHTDENDPWRLYDN